MEYRINRRTGDKISVLGIGSSTLTEKSVKDGVEALRLAYENGVNYYDLAAAQADAFSCFHEGLGDVRKEVLYQIHFGADYTSGSYGWTTSLDKIKCSIDLQLKTLGTDYIDYGFIHCIDEPADWEKYEKDGVIEYICSLKEQGVVHHIGMSSHTPAMIGKAMDRDLVDMVMFSINPAYDYQQGEYANGSVDERSELYRRCEAAGVGISVMKPFSGGQLLSPKTSPFGKALTEVQCIQYALDKPGVLTVLPGVRSKSDEERILEYLETTQMQRDYSMIGTVAPKDAAGKCVYCNHCQPCPGGLDIALINKYYDLARAGDELAAGHYRKLERNASDCLHCGHCDRRCPFHVKQSDRMREIAEYFH